MIQSAEMEKLMQELELGATRRFPEGKLDPTDKGEIKIGITHQDGKVVLAFGTPVMWTGFTPDQAEEIAAMLREHAIRAREQIVAMKVSG